MTPTEAVDLVELVAAMCPAMRMEEKTGEAWYLLLGDLDYPEAVAAAAAVGRTARFITPADIRAQIQATRTRAARTRDSVATALAVPDADPNDVPGYLAALRAGRLLAHRPEQLHQRDMRALPAVFPRPDTPPKPHTGPCGPNSTPADQGPTPAPERPPEARIRPQSPRNPEKPDTPAAPVR